MDQKITISSLKKNQLCNRRTYLELPLCVAAPCFSHAGDDDRLATSLVALNKFLHGQIVDIDSFNSISEAWVIDFEYLILATPVAVGGPLAQQKVASVLRLHVVHLLNERVRHAPCLEDGICQA